MNSGWLFPQFRHVASMCMAIFIGQIGLATIIGGLMARNWITSWFFVVLLACLQTLLPVLLHRLTHRILEPESLLICSLWPLIFLSTCTPLLLFRTLFGWTLRRTTQPVIPRWRSSLEDLVLFGVVVACSITISQTFFYAVGGQTLPQILVIMATCTIFSFLCVPLVVWITFRARSWTERMLAWTALSVVTCGLAFFQNGFMQAGGWASSLRFLPEMLISILGACVIIGIGLTSMLASGYRLTYFEKIRPTSPAGPGDSVDSVQPSAWLDDSDVAKARPAFVFGPTWQARVITGLLICIATICVKTIDSNRQQIVRIFEDLSSKDLLHVSLQDDESIERLEFGPEFTDADLDRYVKYAKSLKSLSFAGTKVTDAVVPKLKGFRHLTEVDLSSSAITDAGLQQLLDQVSSAQSQSMYDGIVLLSLADTKVTWDAIEKFIDRKKLLTLNVSGLGITDAQLPKLSGIKALTLSRNPITDEGLAALLESSTMSYLDVSDTGVTGSTLATANCPMELRLDGTQVSDASLAAIVKTARVKRLSLARTQVTATVLPSLAGKAVRLGDGPITEDDLANLNSISFMHLGLNGKQFTGRCMAIGKIRTDSLDLSYSSVSDEVLQSLPRMTSMHFLGLAHTNVSDRALPRFFVQAIDLRGTRVTAAGLAAANSYIRVILSHDQFSPKDMALLDQEKVKIKERPAVSLGP